MPSTGKSTVGVLLAKLSGLAFRDTDLDIQVHAHATLEEILQRDGYQRLREIEEEILLQVPLRNCVISTGGSVVYSEKAMARLAAAGPVVYLETDFKTLEKRVAGAPNRGIASSTQQSFADIYAERTPLYRRHADLTINTADTNAEQIAINLLGQLTTD
jgi:shikimate kinase